MKKHFHFSVTATQKFVHLFLALFVFGLNVARAQQQGMPDLSFNATDAGFGLGSGASNLVYSATLLPSGKTLIGGSFTAYNGTTINRVAMLTATGSLDAGFAVGTGANSIVYATAVQPDGKLLIAGNFTLFNGTSKVRVARLNTNGTLDATFDTGTGPDAQVSAIAVLPGGKILIGGKFLNYNGQPTGRVARLNSNGTLDTSFSAGTGFDKLVSTFAVQADGKILVGGDFLFYNGTAASRLIRLNTNGTVDPTFVIGTGAAGSVKAIAIQTDGKIVVGGTFKKFNAITRNRIARLNANGILDTGFDPNASSTVFAIALQSGNSMFIGGDFVTVGGITRNRVALLNADGTVNPGFDPLTGFNSSVYSLQVVNGTQVQAAGKFSLFNGTLQGRVSRLSATGALVPTFNPASGANAAVSTISLQPDGRIIIGGSFTGFNGLPLNRIARLQTDGTPDLSFSPGVGPDNLVSASVVQPDGKILIGGTFKKVNGVVTNRIVRLNTDGTRDLSFVIGTGANNSVQAMKLQPDGKILVAGKFTSFNGVAAKYLVRLNPNGSVDPSFNTAVGFNKMVYALALQPDGKIVAAGDFTTYNGTTSNRIIRLNPDGTVDASFTVGTGASASVRALALQTDGKIVLGGAFTKVNGIVRTRLARLNANGTLDTTFDALTGPNTAALALALQTDGKVLVGGDFVSFNGQPIARLARLNSDGTIDTGFTPGTGANAAIQAIAIQPNGRMLIGGTFTSYHTTGRNRVARIFGQPVTPPTVATSPIAGISYCPGGPISVPFTVTGSFDAANIFSALLSDETGSFANPISLGGLAGTTAGTIAGTLPMGIPVGSGYRVKVVASTPGVAGTTNNSNLSVLASPIVAVSATQQAICLGAATALSASGAISYSWTTGQTTSAVTVTPTATTTYTVTGTSGQGCTAQATTEIVVNTPPVLTVSASQAVICAGQSTTLSVSGATSYTWQTANGLVAYSDSAIVTPASPGTYTYSVSGTNGNCAPGQATVQVQVVSGQSATFAYPGNTFCQSAPSPTPTTSTTGTFSATPAGLVFSNVNTGTLNLAASTPGVYTLLFTPNTPCASVSAPATITVTVGPTATVAPVTVGCEGNALVLQANGTSTASYSWTGPNNFSATGASVTIPAATPALNGMYTLTASLGGCAQVATTNVAVMAAPLAGFTVVPGSCAGCVNIFNNNPAPNTYSYNFGDGSSISTHPNPVHEYIATGTYTITQTVTNAAGCSTVTTQIVSVILSASDELAQNTKVYPNPTKGKLVIELPEFAGTGEISAEVFTTTGQLVFTDRLSAATQNELNLNGIKPGAYLLRITTPGASMVKQILLQN